MIEMIKLAGKISLPTTTFDPRGFWLGCVGIRQDGALVSAKNGAVHSTCVDNYQHMPSAHAEGRVLRKLGKGGTLYVARIAKSTKEYAMARPCPMCQTRIKAFGVKKVYYTINPEQYGIWTPSNDTDKVYQF